MSLGTSLQAYLAANTGLAALIGTRIYSDVLKQDSLLPAVVYAVMSGQRWPSLRGTSTTQVSRVQFDARGATRLVADQVAAAIAAALKTLQATIVTAGGPVTVGDVQIHEVDLSTGDTWQSVPPADGSDNWPRVTAQDCRIFYH